MLSLSADLREPLHVGFPPLLRDECCCRGVRHSDLGGVGVVPDTIRDIKLCFLVRLVTLVFIWVKVVIISCWYRYLPATVVLVCLVFFRSLMLYILKGYAF